MRSNYNDEEMIALKEIMKLLAAEISRNTKIMVADLTHLGSCESAEHKQTCIAQAKAALVNILSHLRYCSWIEAELTSTRVFADPLANLAELVRQQEEIAAEYQAKVDPQPEPAVEPVPLLNQPVVPTTASDQGLDMDKLANAPLTKTLQ